MKGYTGRGASTRMSWQGLLEIVVWNVGHGNAASARLPNGNVLMLDCGSNPATGFSPVQATLSRWGRIDALFISHPHMDHIGDIRSIVHMRNIGYPLPRLLVAPPVPPAQILAGKHGRDLDTAMSYVDLKSKYGPLNFDPPALFGHVDVRWFFVKGPHADMNAYSMVTFLRYGAFTFLHAGDLPSNCWQKMIDEHGRQFTDLLSATNFFEVPHHGRDEGYSADALSLMPSLKLGLVSDKEEQKTSVTGKYDRHFEGWSTYNEAAKKQEVRKILTTRNDGRIRLLAGPPGDSQNIAVRCGGGRG